MAPPEAARHLELSRHRAKESHIGSSNADSAATEQNDHQHIVAIVVKEHLQQFKSADATKNGDEYCCGKIKIQRQLIEGTGIGFPGFGVFACNAQQEDERHHKQQQAHSDRNDQRVTNGKQLLHHRLGNAIADIGMDMISPHTNVDLVMLQQIILHPYFLVCVGIVEDIIVFVGIVWHYRDCLR